MHYQKVNIRRCHTRRTLWQRCGDTVVSETRAHHQDHNSYLNSAYPHHTLQDHIGGFYTGMPCRWTRHVSTKMLLFCLLVCAAPHQRAADTFNQDCLCSWAVLSVQLAHKENMLSRASWLNRVGVDCESVSRVIRNYQASRIFVTIFRKKKGYW